MPSIGSINFLFLKGTPVFPGQTVHKLGNRPGVDGDAFRLGGVHGAPSSYTGYQALADDTAVTAMKKSLNDLRGTLQTVVDDYGTSFANVVVMNVRTKQVTAVSGLLIGAEESTHTRVLVTELSLHFTEEPGGSE